MSGRKHSKDVVFRFGLPSTPYLLFDTLLVVNAVQSPQVDGHVHAGEPNPRVRLLASRYPREG